MSIEIAKMTIAYELKVPGNVQCNEKAAETLLECAAFLNSVEDPGTRLELHKTLQGNLDRIGQMGRGGEEARLGGDFAPLSFSWSGGGMVGGLIFHGAHDGLGSGSAPTFSVSLNNSTGWQIHT